MNIYYISLVYCKSIPVFVILENAWAFYKNRKKVVFLIFYFAVQFKLWVSLTVFVTVTVKVFSFSNFDSALGVIK